MRVGTGSVLMFGSGRIGIGRNCPGHRNYVELTIGCVFIPLKTPGLNAALNQVQRFGKRGAYFRCSMDVIAVDAGFELERCQKRSAASRTRLMTPQDISSKGSSRDW